MSIASCFAVLAGQFGCAAPDAAPVAGWEPTASVEAIDSVGQVAVVEGRIVGVSIAVVPNTGEPLMRHFGMADREAGAPVTDETRFNYASVTKPFTALAVLSLVEAGRLALDQRVAEVLPGVIPDDQARQITVRQLLNHTNGLNDYVEADTERWYATGEPLERQFVLDWFADRPLDFAPGTAWSYSNSGFYVATMIIEEITGMRWQDYLAESVLAPLGLESMGPCDEMPVPLRTRGYSGVGDSVELNTARYIEDGVRGDGGLCGTARDLARLPNALRTSGWLSEPTLAEATQPTRLLNGTSVDYGIGFRLGTLDGIHLWGHTGGTETYVAKLAHYVEAGITIVVLVNTVNVDRDPLWIEADVGEIVLDLPSAVAHDSLLQGLDVSPYVGAYGTGRWGGASQVSDIVEEDGVLRRRYTREDSPSELVLIPRGAHTFAHPRFRRDRFVFHVEDGRATGYSEYYQGMFASYQRRQGN